MDILALLDSGADCNLFNAEIAELIGIEKLEAGGIKEFYGIAGKVTAYGHEVLLNVGGHQITTIIYFSRDVGKETVLLGMEGFFDRFIVTFNRAKESTEIMPNKPK